MKGNTQTWASSQYKIPTTPRLIKMHHNGLRIHTNAKWVNFLRFSVCCIQGQGYISHCASFVIIDTKGLIISKTKVC